MVDTVQPTTETAAVPQATGAATWQIDPKHSVVEFAVKHMMFSTVKGRFSDVGGTIVYDATDPSRSTVEVEIDAASIDTHESQRDAHLRSAEFLEVETYPTITFKSTRVDATGAARLRVIGDLTMHGVTREVALDASFLGSGTNPYGQVVAGFSATGELNRKDYGLNWNAALEAGGVLVGDTVKIAFEIEASRA